MARKGSWKTSNRLIHLEVDKMLRRKVNSLLAEMGKMIVKDAGNYNSFIAKK